MSGWTTTDEPAGIPKYANGSLQVVGASSTLHSNNIPGKFVTGIGVGVYGLSNAEMASANGAGVAHAGWVLVKQGTGGRTGRIQSEVLVATSEMTVGFEKDANTFPDTP